MYATIRLFGPLGGYYRITPSPILPLDKSYRKFARQKHDDEGRPYWEPFVPSEEVRAAIQEALREAL